MQFFDGLMDMFFVDRIFKIKNPHPQVLWHDECGLTVFKLPLQLQYRKTELTKNGQPLAK